MAGAVDRVRTTLFLIRHGEAESNRDGCFGGHGPMPLTARGHAQARTAAERLASLGPEVLITSDVVRAAQTATAIAAHTGLTAVASPLWRERTVGIFDGLRFDDAQARHPELWSQFMADRHGFVLPGGEAASHVFDRVGQGLAAALTQHRGKRVAIVSHGIAIFHALCHVVGAGVPGDATPFFALVDNASITTIEHHADVDDLSGRGRYWLKQLNEVAHLPPSDC